MGAVTSQGRRNGISLLIDYSFRPAIDIFAFSRANRRRSTASFQSLAVAT